MMKNLKSILLIFGFLCLAWQNGFAQDPKGPDFERFRELETQRIAFLSREVALTPEEAKIFWPVYNEYNRERLELMQSHRQQRKAALENLEGKSDRELLEIADLDIVQMEGMAELRRKYHVEFLKILPTIKVIRLYEAERRFSREIYRQHRERTGEGRGRGR